MTSSGSSRKGAARRQEILDKAEEFLERDGYAGFSVREIARATGLSQPGLLHYFATKEELVVEVLRERRKALREIEGDSVDVLLTVIDGISNPELVRFFLTVSVEGTVSDHPGHDYFLERYGTMRSNIVGAIRERQVQGTFPADGDAEAAAVMLIAFADGVQMQWLLDRSIDMGARLRELWAVLSAVPSGSNARSH